MNLRRYATPAFAGLALAGTLGLTACDNVDNYGDQQVDTDVVYGRIAATGTDLRYYEFTPKTNPDISCVFVAGSQKGGLECFEKDHDAAAAALAEQRRAGQTPEANSSAPGPH